MSVASCLKSLSAYKDRTVIVIGLLGLVAAIPFPLVFGTLSLWCNEDGLSYTAIGLMGMAKLPYALRFLWAPVLDGYRLPFLSARLGHRKSWLLLIQCGLFSSLLFMAATSPGTNPGLTAIAALLTAFFSASQDIIVDVLRIEFLPENKQSHGAASYIFGYRVGLLFSSAGAMLLSSRIGWHHTYSLLAFFILAGMVAALWLNETKSEKELPSDWFIRSVKLPVKDFLSRKGWYVIVIFLLLYKLNNATISAFANSFYRDCGFSKDEIAYVVKIYGFAATLLGGFWGGAFVSRFPIRSCLLWTGILEGLTSAAFAVQSAVGHNVWLLAAVVSFDNFVGAVGSVALIVYLSSLCNRSYTATQYALLNSLLAISRDVVAANTGVALDAFGFYRFFIVNSFLVLPALIVMRWLPDKAAEPAGE